MHLQESLPLLMVEELRDCKLLLLEPEPDVQMQSLTRQKCKKGLNLQCNYGTSLARRRTSVKKLNCSYIRLLSASKPSGLSNRLV
jgi:hypothetical protein